MLPFIFTALGVAVGAVAGAFTTHAAGESDRKAATHHRDVANELTNKYANLQQKYHELSDESKKQISDLTRQRALDELEKDGLRIAVRLQQSLIELMCEIDREPTEVALKKFVQAVDLTNNVLLKLQEELIIIPSDYYARNFITAVQRQNFVSEAYASFFNCEQEIASKENNPSEIEYNQHMLSEQFQSNHHRLSNLGNQLLQYLQEIRIERRAEGDNAKGLESIENEISKAVKALKEQKYQVAVIAAMKAGKSTFLNAIIGADVLPSETEACTVCRTDIRPIEAGKTPRLIEYREGEVEPVVLIEGEAQEIRQKFLHRTHQIRNTNNSDKATSFQLEYPIEAINQISSLAGFTLVDTPGPNEWKSASFNTVNLKRTALEALRTCNAILFILDYTSFKDNTNSELLEDLIEQRQEFLAQDTGKIYFILNKVDRKAERDREIADVIEDLKKTLSSFGIPNPIIYPVSAWQGLLAKLIRDKTATKEHKEDFKTFFLARYMEEDEDGDIYTPKLVDIAPKTLEDSGIITIENAVIQKIIQNSGWNLLSDVLSVFKKAVQTMDETLLIQLKGWSLEVEQIELNIEEYKKCSDIARSKVAIIKNSMKTHQQELFNEFSREIYQFVENAKNSIGREINRLIQVNSDQSKLNPQEQNLVTFIAAGIKSIRDSFVNTASYLMSLIKLDVIKLENKTDAEIIIQKTNEYCTSIIQEFWLGTQDKLVRQGTKIRDELVAQIQRDIQVISDELSDFLGDSLKLEINPTPIQFPYFEFPGIDAEIKKLEQVVTKYGKETRKKSRLCQSDEVYYVNVPYKTTESYYEINLRDIQEKFNEKIDSQVVNILKSLTLIINKQVLTDFQQGEKQINDYINRFQAEFDYVLRQKATKEGEAANIISTLQNMRMRVGEYRSELMSIEQVLNSWK